MELPQVETSEWLSHLKQYQRSSLSILIDMHGEEEAAKLWLAANGPKDTQKFGGNGNVQPFWDRFVAELRLFICGDKKYNKERKELLQQAKGATALLVSVISGAIGASLGFSASLLAPAVALMLHVIGKVGANAWCNTQQ